MGFLYKMCRKKMFYARKMTKLPDLISYLINFFFTSSNSFFVARHFFLLSRKSHRLKDIQQLATIDVKYWNIDCAGCFWFKRNDSKILFA
jgi:hypothetical protein